MSALASRSTRWTSSASGTSNTLSMLRSPLGSARKSRDRRHTESMSSRRSSARDASTRWRASAAEASAGTPSAVMGSKSRRSFAISSVFHIDVGAQFSPFLGPRSPATCSPVGDEQLLQHPPPRGRALRSPEARGIRRLAAATSPCRPMLVPERRRTAAPSLPEQKEAPAVSSSRQADASATPAISSRRRTRSRGRPRTAATSPQPLRPQPHRPLGCSCRSRRLRSPNASHRALA